jgi:hypothetical protein
MDFTYGLELEFGLLDRTKTPILGCKYSEQEMDVASRHPDGKITCSNPADIHTAGGEVNTPPSNTIEEQVEMVKKILEWQPQVNVNHRLHLHTHVAFPGLCEDLPMMKKILKYIQDNADFVLNTVYVPTRHPKMNASAWSYQITDQSRMPDYKYKFCMDAETVEDFRNSHAKIKNGNVAYQFMKRYAVNLYSIFKHGTIEFRHFFPTLNPDHVRAALEYSKKFVEEAIGDQTPVRDWFFLSNNQFFSGRTPKFNLPKEVAYDDELELFWQANNFKGGKREDPAEDL